MALRELFAIFDVQVNAEGLKNLETNLDTVAGKLKSVAGVFGSFFLAGQVTEFIKGQIKIGEHIDDLSQRLGVNVHDLQQWQYAAVLSGVEAEAAANSLNFLNKAMGKAAEGDKGATKAFASLGLNIRNSDGSLRGLQDVLPDVAEKFEKLGSQQERAALAQKLFGRSGQILLPLFAQGSKGLEALYAEFERLGGGMSKKFVDDAAKAGDELDRFRFVGQNLKASIAGVLLPSFTKLTQHLTGMFGWMVKVTKQTNIVQGALIALGGAGVFSTVRLFANFAGSLGLIALQGGGAAFSFGKMAKELLSLGLRAGFIVGMLGLLFLVAEDIYTLFTGGKSAIGDWLDEFGGVGTATTFVKDMRDAFKDLSDAMNQAVGEGQTVKSVLGDGLKWTFDFVVGGVVQLTEWLGALVRGFAEVVKAVSDPKKYFSNDEFIKRQDAETLKAQDDSARAAVARMPKFTGKDTIGAPGAYATDGIRADVPLPPSWNKGGKGRGGGSLEQSNNINVVVQGGSNPQETGRNVKGGVQDALDAHAQNAMAALVNLGGT